MIELSSSRLLLREITISDLHSVHALHAIPETDQFNTTGIPESIETTRRILNLWLEEKKLNPLTYFVFCLLKKDTKEFIGLIGLKPGKPGYRSAEVWFKVHKNYWQQGFATEALRSLLHFGLHDLKLHRIEAGCAVENIASFKTLEKVGMIQEGRKRKNLPIRGQWHDNYVYGILADDYFR